MLLGMLEASVDRALRWSHAFRGVCATWPSTCITCDVYCHMSSTPASCSNAPMLTGGDRTDNAQDMHAVTIIPRSGATTCFMIPTACFSSQADQTYSPGPNAAADVCCCRMRAVPPRGEHELIAKLQMCYGCMPWACHHKTDHTA